MLTKKPIGPHQPIDPDDAPALTKDMLDDAEVFDGDHFVRRGRGRPKAVAAREQISVRLDPDILRMLRAAGPGWQSQINTLLREALAFRSAEPRDKEDVAADARP